MTDLPTKIDIQEEGPREGFQIEPGPISTARKIELVDALTDTGLKKIQVASFVNPKKVPGWADAAEVVSGFRRKEGVAHHVLWLNEKGLHRALDCDDLYMFGSISTTTSETFMGMNTNRGFAENAVVQRNQIGIYQANGIAVTRASIMTAFGCNFEGDIAPSRVVERLEELLRGYRRLGDAAVREAGCRRGAKPVAGQTRLPASARYPGLRDRERLCGAGNGRRSL
jgi:hydroxymethylglutaryl-CoA lyase